MCVSFTGFSPGFLAQFIGKYSSQLEPSSTYGSGRRSSQTAEIRGIIVLNYLRNSPNLETARALFGLSPSVLEKTLCEVIPKLVSVVSADSLQISYQHSNEPFEFFPNCFAALDTTFIPHPYPSGLSFVQAKDFFSVKHGKYGYKWLVVVNSSGHALYISGMFPAGTVDLLIATNPGVLPHIQRICGERFVLCDKGFLGLQEHVRAIIPHRKLKTRALS